ncbi:MULTISPECIES: helix-turn-helix domain-containing protein [unclassified Actinopolyspora]|uniref:MmyB family transcriptional regulator n=1 Tax=unclassified Actinopolyspora TaxID=2639451 RepID=UPI0013F59D01|nr:helix-turn-helix domain-containing protein [Actinopolyspora sp. BKK2]NHE75728.1 helix-turn-helix domain-containing protein [Actinopolyspora sp. BKK1]
MPRAELADFLRTRRARLTPADVGVPSGQRRRTPGLRRDEVARLAHMSVDYYTRLEQARGPRPSARVLDTLAEALHLSLAERAHLFRLAGAAPVPPAEPVRRVRPHVAAMLHRVPGTAALVTDATYNAVAWNPLAEALLEGLRDEPNLARRHFLRLGPAESPETEAFGPIAAARLRAASARYPNDEPLSRLLSELFARSAEFRGLWDTHPVHTPGNRRKVLTHSELGRLRVNCDVLPMDEDDQQLVLVTADPGSPTAEVFARLGERHGS